MPNFASVENGRIVPMNQFFVVDRQFLAQQVANCFSLVALYRQVKSTNAFSREFGGISETLKHLEHVYVATISSYSVGSHTVFFFFVNWVVFQTCYFLRCS